MLISDQQYNYVFELIQNDVHKNYFTRVEVRQYLIFVCTYEPLR